MMFVFAMFRGAVPIARAGVGKAEIGVTRDERIRHGIMTLIGMALFLSPVTPGWANEGSEGARFIDTAGYADCVELSNGTTRVVIEPNMGGRVLSYALEGEEVLFQDARYDGVLADTKLPHNLLPGGRFDLGPELTLPPREAIWSGRWRAEIIGPRHVRLTSAIEPSLGLQVIRRFELGPENARLVCEQTVVNRGGVERSVSYWGRTFVPAGGVCLVPLNPRSRFPAGYLEYLTRDAIGQHAAEDPRIMSRDGVLIIDGTPLTSKVMVDASDGWLAYITRGNLLFLTTFPIETDRLYGGVASDSVAIWFDALRCELEPLGPLERLPPGEAAVFTQVWSLHPFTPTEGGMVDMDSVRSIASRQGIH